MRSRRQDRQRIDQRPALRAASAQLAHDAVPDMRRRGQLGIGARPDRGRHLVEQRQDVAWVAAGVPRQGRRPSPDAACGRACGEFGASRGPSPARAGSRRRPDRDTVAAIASREHHQHRELALMRTAVESACREATSVCSASSMISSCASVLAKSGPRNAVDRGDRVGDGVSSCSSCASTAAGRVGLPTESPAPNGVRVLVGQPAQQCGLADAGRPRRPRRVRAAGRGG